MIGPDKKAMAVRKPDGSIQLEEMPMTRLKGMANLIFVRGSVRLFRQLVSGTKALLRSAELLDEASVDTKPAESASTLETTTINPVDSAATAESTTESDAPVSTVKSAVETVSEAPANPTDAGKKSRRTFKDRREALDQKLDHFLTHHSDLMLYISAVGGILFSVVLFILLPNFLTSGVGKLTGLTATSAVLQRS